MNAKRDIGNGVEVEEDGGGGGGIDVAKLLEYWGAKGRDFMICLSSRISW